MTRANNGDEGGRQGPDQGEKRVSTRHCPVDQLICIAMSSTQSNVGFTYRMYSIITQRITSEQITSECINTECILS
jgi:hypothetical protein